MDNWSEVDEHIGFMVPFPFEVNYVLRLCIIVTIRVFVLTIVPLPFCGSSSIYIGFIYTQVGGLSLEDTTWLGYDLGGQALSDPIRADGA